MIAGLLLVGCSFFTPSTFDFLARAEAYALVGQRENEGEFKGQEKISLVAVSKGRPRHLVTLSYRWDHDLPDRLHVLGNHVVAEVNTGASTSVLFVVKVVGGRANIVTPFEDKSILDFFGGTAVKRIGNCLVGCIWVSPDLFPSEWGSYMFIVTGKNVTWGRLPLKDHGFSVKPGPANSSFQITFPCSHPGKSSALYKWPPKIKNGKWILILAE